MNSFAVDLNTTTKTKVIENSENKLCIYDRPGITLDTFIHKNNFEVTFIQRKSIFKLANQFPN